MSGMAHQSRLQNAPSAPRLPRMPARSLTIVLPAYNEEARIGGALDELFGYLHRRGDSGRDGRPGAADLPSSIMVLIVDDGSTDGTASLVRARPEFQASDLQILCGAPWRERGRRQGGHAGRHR